MYLKTNIKRRKRNNLIKIMVTLIVLTVVLVPSIFAVQKIYAATNVTFYLKGKPSTMTSTVIYNGSNTSFNNTSYTALKQVTAYGRNSDASIASASAQGYIFNGYYNSGTQIFSSTGSTIYNTPSSNPVFGAYNNSTLAVSSISNGTIYITESAPCPQSGLESIGYGITGTLDTHDYNGSTCPGSGTTVTGYAQGFKCKDCGAAMSLYTYYLQCYHGGDLHYVCCIGDNGGSETINHGTINTVVNKGTITISYSNGVLTASAVNTSGSALSGAAFAWYDASNNLLANGSTYNVTTSGTYKAKVTSINGTATSKESTATVVLTGASETYNAYLRSSDLYIDCSWTPITYYISYNLNGGTHGSSHPTSAKYDTAFTVSNPSRTGYTFSKWTLSNQSSTAYYSGTTLKNLSTTNGATVTLTANWNINAYTLTVYCDAGTNNTGTKTGNYNYGTAVSISGSPKTGYMNTKASQTITSMPANNVTINLTSTPITYYVKYNGNGNTGGSTATSTHKYDSAQALTANGFVKTGYNFAGWATSSSATSAAYSNGQSVVNLSSTNGQTVNLYAIWTPQKYTLTYDANGGTCSETSKTITYDSTYGTFPTPTRTGWTFTGWFTSASGGSEIKSSTKVQVTSNQTIYAHWLQNDYTLTVEKSTGVKSVSGGGVYHYQDPVSITYVLEEGYKFKEIENNVTSMPPNNHTAKVVAEPIVYEIHYDGNESTSGSMTNSTHIYNEEKAINENNYLRDGHTYLGWSKTSTDASLEYTDKQKVLNLTQVDGDVINFYAIWQINDYKLTFNANGGECLEKERIVTYHDAFGTLPEVTREGYLFAGWYLKDGDTFKERVYADTIMTSSDKTVYARWISVDLISTKEYSVVPYDVIPTVKYIDNDQDVPVSYYTVTCPDGLSLSDVGVYTITITGDDTNVYGQIVKTLEITQRELTLDMINVDDSALMYNGTSLFPVVTVVDNLVTLLDTEYQLEYENNINAGEDTCILRVTPLHNYKGDTLEITFSIAKRELDINNFKLFNGDKEVTSTTLVTKERDEDNNKKITDNYKLSLRYTYENSPFSELVKLNGDFRYNRGTPIGNIDDGFTPINILSSNLVLDDSVIDNYTIIDNKNSLEILNLGLIEDTIRPCIETFERTTGDTYGEGKVMKFVITTDESIEYESGCEIKLLLASENGTPFKNKYAEITAMTSRKMIFEYIVDKEDDGKNGMMQISLSISGGVTDAYLNNLNTKIESFVSQLNPITINTDGFNVPLSCNPDINENDSTNLDEVVFTFDFIDIELLDTIKPRDIISSIEVYVDGEKKNVSAVKDKNDSNKYNVTVKTGDYITSDNRDGIIITAKLPSGKIKNSINNDNLESSKSIKVMRTLNADDIIVTYKGNELSHESENISALDGDIFTISLKDSVLNGVKLAYNALSNLNAPVTETITNKVNEFKDIMISKTGWANSDPFTITFHVRDIEDLIKDINNIYSNSGLSDEIKAKKIKSLIDNDYNRNLIGLTSEDEYISEHSYVIASRLLEIMDVITISKDNFKDLINQIIEEIKEADDYIKSIQAFKLNDKNIELKMIEYELFPQSIKDYINSNEVAKAQVLILKEEYDDLLKTYNYNNKQTVTNNDGEDTDFEVYGLINYVQNSNNNEISLEINQIETTDSVEKDYEYVYAQIEKDPSLSGYSPMLPYEIGLYQQGSKLSNNAIDDTSEGILIKLTLPKDYYTSSVKVVHVKDNGDSEVLPTKHKTLEKIDGVTYCNLYFYTKSFSDFILITDKNIITVHEMGDGGRVTCDKNIEYSKSSNIKIPITLEPKTKATIKVTYNGYENLNLRDELINESEDEEESFVYRKFTSEYTKQIAQLGTKVIIYVIYSSSDEIKNLDENEPNHLSYMTGYNDNTFKPNNEITRAEIVTILARTNDSYSEDIDYSSYAQEFLDVVKNSWCENYIGFAKSKDYIEGYKDKNMKAKNYITKGEMAAIVCRYLGFKTVDSSYSKIADAKGKWYEPYVNTLMYYGYIAGTSSGGYDGDKYMTRAEACTIINKCINRNIKQSLTEEEQKEFETRFTDVTKKWYYYDIYEATTSYYAPEE